jgi:hypothetical protein
VKHRDWYVDEGAGDPVLGFIAVASGAVTGAVGAVVSYSRSMSKTIRKRPAKDSASSSSNEEAQVPTLAYTASLDCVYTHNPVTQANENYSEQHVESLAFKMASKTLPNYTDKKTQENPLLVPGAAGLTPEQATTRPQPTNTAASTMLRFETGQFAQTIVATGLRVPVSFFYNLANGFHNAPYVLLNDDTVRRRDNITGLGSGVKVASKEVVFGLYDGFTGLVTQPYNGTKKDGVVGFGKGVGRGFGGLVFKTSAAAFGMTGYTLKGVEKQFEKRLDRGLKANLIAQRLKQGLRQFGQATEEDKKEILKRWADLGVSGTGR